MTRIRTFISTISGTDANENLTLFKPERVVLPGSLQSAKFGGDMPSG